MEKNNNNKTILIVEDDTDFSSILETKFKIEGFSVVLAKDGEEGARLVQKLKPDLIISDILLPKLDGFEMAQKIRQTDKNVKIIFLTNTRDAEYTRKIEEIGNFEYLIKSEVRIGDILEKVKNYFGIPELIVPSRL